MTSIESVLRCCRTAALALAFASGAQAEQTPRLLPLDLAPHASAMAALGPERTREIRALVEEGVAALRREMAAGRLTAVELAAFHLARIAAQDERLRAFVSINPAALDEARAADATQAAARALGATSVRSMGSQSASRTTSRRPSPCRRPPTPPRCATIAPTWTPTWSLCCAPRGP